MPLPRLLSESTPMIRTHKPGRFIISSRPPLELGPAAIIHDCAEVPLPPGALEGFKEEIYELFSYSDRRVPQAPDSDGVRRDEDDS